MGPRRENRGEACGFCPPGQLSRATCRWGLEGSAWGCGWARIPFHVHQHQFRAPGRGPEKHGGLIKPWCLPARSFQAMEKRDVGKTGSGVGALVFMGEVATDAWDPETGENTCPSRQGESFVCLFVCVFLLFIGDIFKSLWQYKACIVEAHVASLSFSVPSHSASATYKTLCSVKGAHHKRHIVWFHMKHPE